MRFSRKFWTVPLMMILLFSAGCSRGTQQKPVEPFVRNNITSNPQKLTTYANKEMNFSVSYPAEWRVAKTSQSSISFFYQGTGGEPAFQVSRIDEPLADVYGKKKKQSPSSTETPALTLGDKPAKGLCFTSLEGNYCEYYVDMGSFTFLVSDYSKEEVYKTFQAY